MEYLNGKTGIEAFNLGTGHGYSVLELMDTFKRASGIPVAYQVVDRRPGDVAVCYADATKAAKMLGWKAEKSLLEMCTDSWRWQRKNPNGYEQTII